MSAGAITSNRFGFLNYKIMTTPQQHADSQIRLIKLKAEIAKLEAQEAEVIMWSQIATIAGLIITIIALISAL